MKVSKSQVEENRRAILAAAGRLFRERGFDSVSVSDVMKAAGLTHGAFYGYFGSKDELIAAALAALASPTGPYSVGVAAYLSAEHRDDCAGGCPLAALAVETGRASPEARAAMAAGVETMIARRAAGASGDCQAAGRKAAIGRAAAMVGALVLSRAVKDAPLSEEVLEATRDWLDDRDGAAR